MKKYQPAFLIVAIVCLFLFSALVGIFFSLKKRENFYFEPVAKRTSPEILSVAPDLPKAEPISMLFFGDLMLDREVGIKIRQRSFGYLFEKIKESDLFINKDIIGANLEGAITQNGQHYTPANTYDFAFSPEIIGQLKNYNFNFFNIANNHLIDQGSRGVNETRQNLDLLNIDYSGCPDGQVGDCSWNIIEIKNQKIGFAGFSAVYSKLNLDQIGQIIQGLASSTDYVVVSFHWGNEYSHNFSQTQQAYAHALIDAGADLIVGHHPHVVQGIEIYKEKPIFYSLGNFIFDQYFSVDTQRGLALQVVINGAVFDLVLVPIKLNQSQIELPTPQESADLLQKIASWSLVDVDFAQQIRAGKLNFNKNSF